MSTDVLLPQWGMGMNEGQVVKWLKKEGDPVSKGDALVEIESAKVNAEVEATADGVLGKILVPEGTDVPVGTRLGVLLSEGEDSSILDSIEPYAAPAPPKAPTLARRAPAAATATRGAGRRQVVTPRARRLATELGVDLETVQGTGPSGRVTEDDVRRTAEEGPAPSGGGSDIPVREVIPVTGLRGAIARRMTESSRAPAVTLNTHVDVTAAVDLQRRLLAAWRRNRLRPQYQDLVLAATVKALEDTPLANAHLVGDELRIMDEINLGVAVAVPDGLIVPVIRNASGKTVIELAQGIRELVRLSRNQSLGIDQMTGSTFTVTNLASYDVDQFNPLLNPPEIGILGVGRIEVRPTFVDGEVAARSIGHLCLTFDHRAWDGAPAAEFLRKVANNLRDPEWMAD